MNNKQIKKRTIELYRDQGWKRYFAYIRFWDAPLEKLESVIPKNGTITELGCGDGIFSNYLALSSPKRNVIGIDIDEKRIKTAKRGLPNTTYVLGDIRKTQLPPSDTIIISHVLHHLSSHQEQTEVLKACKEKLKKGGTLVIMEIHITPSPKYILGRIFDHFLVPIFFEKRLYSNIYYRKSNEWKNELEYLGFNCRIIPVSAGKPISNIIIICST